MKPTPFAISTNDGTSREVKPRSDDAPPNLRFGQWLG